MKTQIPFYNKNSGDLEKAFDSLSKTNQKIVEKQALSWSSTAGKNKVYAKRKNLIKFADFLEKDLDKVTNDDYLKFASALNKSNLADTTKNDLRKHLKEFLRDNYEDWSKRFNNLKQLKTHKEKIPRKYEQLPKQQEFEKLLLKTSDIMLKCVLALHIETAARGSEILKAKIGDWNKERKEITLISTKNKTTRTILLNKSQTHLERWLKEYPYKDHNTTDYLFPSPENRNKPITLGWYNSKLRKLGQEVFRKPLSSYCIRHSVLTYLQKKLPAKVYERIADHSIKTAERYSHLDSDDLSEALQEFVYQVPELTETEKDELKTLRQQVENIKELLIQNAIGNASVTKAEEERIKAVITQQIG